MKSTASAGAKLEKAVTLYHMMVVITFAFVNF
jgi:hypothetical protein